MKNRLFIILADLPVERLVITHPQKDWKAAQDAIREYTYASIK